MDGKVARFRPGGEILALHYLQKAVNIQEVRLVFFGVSVKIWIVKNRNYLKMRAVKYSHETSSSIF